MKCKTQCATLLIVAFTALTGLGSRTAGGAEADPWTGYIDFAYVYSSAEPEALQMRLEEYGNEAGVPLERYITEHFAAPLEGDATDEVFKRRRAIAYLLHYLAYSDKKSLEKSVETAHSLEDRLERHENRYWYRYIMANQALEKGRSHDFVGEMLDLWSEVVVPLETPFEALQTLSLDGTPNSGFASALPYIYENVARLILIRSQEMGVNKDLDPLGAIVRMLLDKRVGAYPDVIPLQASARGYLERIVNRLNGPESDAGSLTFTLALFEANKMHEKSRELLATEGLSEESVKAIRVATGAYQTALDRAFTTQGEVAVYTRVLRQLGEVYAAKQRLGVDPEIEAPFHMEDIIEIYNEMVAELDTEKGWRRLGYAKTGRESYVEAMVRLWEEVQEATLNIADYYLSKAAEQNSEADESARNAARLYGRYLAFFLKYATSEEKEGIPDSAYFAAHEAAKGVGDAFLLYAQQPTAPEIDLAARRYRAAMKVFPFDRTLFTNLAAALERQGRESEYLGLVLPAAEDAVRSRALNAWIDNGEPGAQKLATLRRALSDSQALMYLGFAEARSVEELEEGLADLRTQRDTAEAKLKALRDRRFGVGDALPAAPADDDWGSASGAGGLNAAELEELNLQITETQALVERLNKQVDARTRTLPIYKSVLETDGLAGELRGRRDHPMHVLLRRMYHEARG